MTYSSTPSWSCSCGSASASNDFTSTTYLSTAGPWRAASNKYVSIGCAAVEMSTPLAPPCCCATSQLLAQGRHQHTPSHVSPSNLAGPGPGKDASLSIERHHIKAGPLAANTNLLSVEAWWRGRWLLGSDCTGLLYCDICWEPSSTGRVPVVHLRMHLKRLKAQV